MMVWYVGAQETLTLKGETDGVGSVALSPDGIASPMPATRSDGVSDGGVMMWDAETRKEARTVKGHTEKVASVAFSPDGERIASTSEDGTRLRYGRAPTSDRLRE